MFVGVIVLLLLVLQSVLSDPRQPSRGCSSCKVKPTQSLLLETSNVTALAAGEPCGVYTLSCARGLRCAPLEDDPKPLRTLLEGRGVCSNGTNISSTEQIQTGDAAPTENPDEAPCRKLLTTLIRGLDAHLFQSGQDIYMPNCDQRGFFRRKQCWSSRGKKRGRCWCVDENGMPAVSRPKQKQGSGC